MLRVASFVLSGIRQSPGARRLSPGGPLVIRAMEISGPGSIDSPMIQAMQEKLKTQLEAENVVVTDVAGDGRHVAITVVSNAFEGKSQVNRQRMVYKVIWEELQSVVHAVDAMVTRTPEEAEASKARRAT